MSNKHYLHDNITPYAQKGLSKKQQVVAMFNNVAYRYDFLNRLLSFNIDVWWRKKAIHALMQTHANYVLDVACGTGDLSIMAAQKKSDIQIIGVDISEKMLEINNQKVARLNLNHNIRNQLGDAENLTFSNEKFEAAMVAFGIRNFENLDKGLKEIARVLKKDGSLIILEFSKPKNFFVRIAYRFYGMIFMRSIGGFFSGDRHAYRYLNNSSDKFLKASELSSVLMKQGFNNIHTCSLTFGICTMYVARK